MSVMAMFRQLTFMASPKSFSLIDLPYLLVKETTHSTHGCCD
jgi:hypothetical protein